MKKFMNDIKNSINEEKIKFENYKIKNVHRAVGTRNYHIIFIKNLEKMELEKDTVEINLSGSAGQSLGSFWYKRFKTKCYRRCK